MKIRYVFLIAIMMITFGILCMPKVNAADDEGNLVIVLDPGHGGNDPGTLNAELGIKEAEVNYKIAIYTKEELEKYEGVKVYLTRYANNPSIYERGEFAKNYQADLVVSQHINSGSKTASGAEIWVTQDNTKVEFYEKSKEVGEKILNKLSGLGLVNHGVSTKSGKPNEWYESGVVKDYYGIIRYPMNYGIRSILVEHCYMSNNSDCLNYISNDEQIRRLGIADAQGIVEAYQLEKKGEGKAPVKSLGLDKVELNLEITASDPEPVNYIYPVFTPSNAYNQGVDWYSSNPEVVRVWDGKVRGLKEGEATITAISRNNQRIAKIKVVVTKPSVPLQNISLDKQEMILMIDEKSRINANITPSNASDQTLYWEASDPEVIRVWDGDIRGLKEGKSTVKVTSRASGKTATCEVIVRDPNKVYVESISVPKEYSVNIDEAVDIPIEFTPENADNAEFEWTTNNPEIIRVWGNRFRALKEGVAEITVRTLDGTVEEKIKVVVKDPDKKYVEEIKLEASEYTIATNQPINIPFEYTPKDADNAEFEWTAENPKIVRVWENRIRGLQKGETEVTVKTLDGTVEAKLKVIVTDPVKVDDIILEQTEYTINVDEAVDVPFTFTPDYAINAEFEWTTENPEIVRVWGNRFRGLKKGEATVIVKTLDGTVERKIKVIVKDPQKVEDILLNQTEYTIYENQAVDIPFDFTPANAINAEFEWTVEDPEIVRVWGNRIRGLKQGKTEVIVRTLDGTVEKRIPVTVKKGVNVQDITLEQTEYTVKVNEAIDIPFEYAPDYAINAEFEWLTDNEEVMRVWGNRFRALKEGTAKVIVRTLDGSIEKQINVTVTK